MPNPSSENNQIEWKNRIEEQRQSGLSINKWCQQNQIPPTSFHYWKEKFSPKQLQKSSFAELSIKRADAISLQARGLHVRIGSDCDPILRKQLFVLFAEAAC